MTAATIQALDGWDEEGGTVYVLCRPGHDSMVAAWPHPLLEIEPGARWLPANTGDVTRRQAFVTMRPVPVSRSTTRSELLSDDLLAQVLR